MTVTSIHRLVRATGIVAVAALSFGCGDVARSGRSPAQLVIETLVGVPGDSPSSKGNSIISDVQTKLTTPAPCTTDVPCVTWINDSGEVTMSLILKNQGVPGVVSAPSTLNAVTLTRYHVEFVRTDGRNTQGVDVPYAFDGAFTVTVPADGNATAGFDLVRHDAKKEAPLIGLVCSPASNVGQIDGSGTCPPMISTIANITFYGRDQVGNDVLASGSISVTFGDVIRAQ